MEFQKITLHRGLQLVHILPLKSYRPPPHHLPHQLFVCLCVRCGIGILEGPDTTSMGLTRTKDQGAVGGGGVRGRVAQ